MCPNRPHVPRLSCAFRKSSCWRLDVERRNLRRFGCAHAGSTRPDLPSGALFRFRALPERCLLAPLLHYQLAAIFSASAACILGTARICAQSAAFAWAWDKCACAHTRTHACTRAQTHKHARIHTQARTQEGEHHKTYADRKDLPHVSSTAQHDIILGIYPYFKQWPCRTSSLPSMCSSVC